MRLKNYFQKNRAVGIFLAATLLMLTSCGSYEYASYDDGIYGEARSQRNQVPTRTVAPETETTSNYYANYFSEKSAQIDNAIEQDAIFTDVDSYSSENYDPADSTNVALNYESGQPAWGSDYDEISVNIYNTGWNNWGWNAGWGPGLGFGWNNWGWNNWGWNAGWGYGWNNWGWNVGFGNPYWYGGGFWCPPYYNNGYGFYGRNRIAYNRGYRNRGFRSAYASNYRNRGAYNSRSRSYNNRSRSRSYNRRSTYNNRRRISADNNRRARTSTYSNRARSQNNRSYSRSRSNSSNTRSYRGNSRSRSSSGTRSYSGSRSSRSSGSVRSSRSSGRSSGSRSSGSRGSSRSRGGRG